MFQLFEAYPTSAYALVAFAWLIVIAMIILFFKGADCPNED